MPLHERLLVYSLRQLSRLPFWWLYRLSDLLYPLIYYVVRYRRRVVRGNIDRSFPDRPVRERRRIERRFYRFFCDYAFETIKLLTITPEEMRRRMAFVGVDEMDDALDDHPFVFLLLGHYGNWEWISTLAMWSERHCAQLYTPLHNHTMDDLFLKLRSRFGAENIAKRDVLRRVAAMRSERIPHHIGFIADQGPTPNSIHHWIEFLHQDTAVFTGAERIGKRVGAAAWFVHVTRPRRGYYECHVEPLVDDMRDLPDFEVTDRYMRRLEAEINEAPHLWLWSHRRWKYRHTSGTPAPES